MTSNRNLKMRTELRSETETANSGRVTPGKNYLAALALLVLCTMQSAFSQTTFEYGFDYDFETVLIDGKQTECAIANNVVKYLPAQAAGLQENDVIVAIDGQPVSKKVFDEIDSKSKINLSIQRFGNQKETLEIAGVPCLSNNRVLEREYVGGTGTAFFGTLKIDDNPINIMSDPDIDFFQYTSFDFEFTGQNIMQQKEIAPSLEEYLTARGLKRDKENPDILVFIDFFSDRREQYVPPTQELSTRYGSAYNVWTKKMEVRQYVESSQSGNYTKIDYLSKLSISMADAKKMSKGEMDKAKIWEADYEVIYRQKADHKQFASHIGWLMLGAFPFKIQDLKTQDYWYTGIIYDGAAAGKVTGVVPDSPADKAGIKPGDMIKSSSWGSNAIFKKSFDEVEEAGFTNGYFRGLPDGFALYRSASLQPTGGSKSPLESTYMSCYEMEKNVYVKISRGSEPLIFTIKGENGKKREVEVKPIKANHRFIGLE